MTHGLARFRASPSRQPCSTEPGSSSSRSATWLVLAQQWQEKDSESVAVPLGTGTQSILTMCQHSGRMRPLIQAIAKLTASEWASLKGPLRETSAIGQRFNMSLC